MIKHHSTDLFLWKLLGKQIGNKVQNKIGNPPDLKRIAATIALGYGSYKVAFKAYDYFFSKNNKDDLFETQGCVLSKEIGKVPTPETTERNNVWYKNDYETTVFDISPLTSGMNGLDMQELEKILMRNCVFFVSHHEPDMMRVVRATCVAGHIYMTNNHAFPDDETFYLEIIQRQGSDGVTSNIKILVHQNDIKRYPQKDLAFIQINNLPPRKNITNLFSKPSLRGNFRGIYLGRDDDGSTYRQNIENINYAPHSNIEALNQTMNIWIGKSTVQTHVGDCGSLLVVRTNYGPIILGIHMLGKVGSADVGIACVTCEDVEAGIKHFGNLLIETGNPVLSAPGKERQLTSLHAKSCVRFSEKGVANVYGSFAGFHPRGKSSVGPTYIQKAMIYRGYKILHGKPIMGTWEPWYLAFKDMIRPVTKINTQLLRECVENFTNDILTSLEQSELNQVFVYDDITAINGAAGVAFVDKINRNTSMGNPWKCSKRFYMKAIEPVQGLLDPVEFDKDVMDRVNDCINKYKNGQRYMPNFCGHLKDEALPFKKIESKKTRVFTGAPVDWTIVVRKYLMSVVRLIQNNRFIFESGPGTIAQSLEWQEIHQYLTVFGKDRIVAGDYGKFDKRMPSTIILAAFDIIINICRAAGYTDEELLVVRGIAEDTAFPLVDFNGDLIEFYGCNPSGHPLTVIINGLANGLYMRLCYAMLSEKGHCKDFKENVHLLTYGDDNIMGVAKNCSFFNHTTIQKTLGDMDIEYTMADKEAESIPYIHIDDASFLKRSWRYDEDVGAYLAPLDHDSINKMVTVCVASKSVTPQAQSVSIIETALREYFYYGKEIFNQKRNMFLDVVEDCHLSLYVKESTFPTWDQLYEQFWFCSQHVNLDIDLDPSDSVLKGNQLQTFSRRMCQNNNTQNINNRGRIVCGNNANRGVGSHQPPISPRLKGADSKDLFIIDENGWYVPNDKAYTPDSVLFPIRRNLNFDLDLQTESQPNYNSNLEPDAGVKVVSNANSENKMGLLKYKDENAGYKVDFNPIKDNTIYNDYTIGTELNNFFSRPVLVGTFSWIQGTPFTTQHLPIWYSYFNDTRVKKKLDNYAYIACNLNVKVMLNASPFHYGVMLVSYKPQSGLSSGSITVDTSGNYQILSSQRPHIWLYPSNSQGGEMTLPYFNFKSYINATSAIDMQGMGSLDFDEVVALTNANSISSSTINIQVYAWATDVRLVGSTVSLSLQSKSVKKSEDEFSEPNGVISKPATTATNILNKLSSVPVIGNYAQAAANLTGSIASISSYFGYSNTPVIKSVEPLKPFSFHSFANPELSQPVDRLTLDPKNELTIDPKTVGLPERDELALLPFIQRESLLCLTTFAQTNIPNDTLWSCRVEPDLFATSTISGQIAKYCTPLSYIQEMFKYWRGDIIFRFRFICTRFHRGRVRITWDPIGTGLATDPVSSTVCFNRIVDISEENDIEITVPFVQDIAFCACFSGNTTKAWYNGVNPLTKSIFDNGIINMTCFTELSAPVTNAPCNVLISVRAGENFQFACPREITNTLSAFQPQTKSISKWELQSASTTEEQTDPIDNRANDLGYDNPTREQIAFKNTSNNDNLFKVHHGEIICSLRTLMNRTTLGFSSNQSSTSVSNQLSNVGFVHFMYPPVYGYDPNGINSGSSVVTGNVPFNFVPNTPFNWITQCFIGMRGSMIWHYNVRSPNIPAQFIASRSERALTIAGYNIATNIATGASSSYINAYNVNQLPGGYNGMALTNANTQAGISINVPFYSNYRFIATHRNFRTLDNGPVTTNNSNVYVSAAVFPAFYGTNTYQATKIDAYYSTGPDFNVFFFINVPTLWSMTVPTPN